MIRFFVVFCCFFVVSYAFCYGLTVDEMSSDQVLEQRVRALSKNLRCLVCQGENLDESTADFAIDLRQVLRERLAAGDDDNQAIAYIVDRYGDYILLNPPLRGYGWLIWLFPVGLVVIGGMVFIKMVRTNAV